MFIYGRVLGIGLFGVYMSFYCSFFELVSVCLRLIECTYVRVRM